HRAYDTAAMAVAIDAKYAARDGEDPRTWGSFTAHVAEFCEADTEEKAAHKHLMAMYEKRDQDAQVSA
ncbi:MAG: hypothetical protein ACRDTJ_16360, partial [Pseudonocardiaceae bacterium]